MLSKIRSLVFIVVAVDDVLQTWSASVRLFTARFFFLRPVSIKPGIRSYCGAEVLERQQGRLRRKGTETCSTMGTIERFVRERAPQPVQ